MSVVAKPVERSRRTRSGIIDCDVHNGLPSPDALKPYLASRWHEYYDQLPGRSHAGISPKLTGEGPGTVNSTYRADTWPESGGQPGSDLQLMREQLLDKYAVRYAILSPIEVMLWPAYGESALALCEAMNRWLAADWLDHDERLRASILVPMEDPLRAAQEIARAADDPRFVQVFLLAGTPEPLGHPKYLPLFEAAVEAGLPVAIHVAGFGGAITGAGWVTYYLERHASWAYNYQAHLASLLYNGTFTHLPELQLVFEECRITWLPPLMWRLDRAWRERVSTTPYLSGPPSDVIRRHIWLTTQPVDEPHEPRYLIEALDQLGMDDRIMFSTDYPHWDFDAPDRVIPPALGRERIDRIFSGNAETLYRFAP